MALVRYFGGLWMTFNEELQGQISACLQRTYICIIYTTHRMMFLLVLKEKTKIVVEYPHPRIRKFSNICFVCFSSVHLFCRNTQMRLLVQPHESCHKYISKRGIFL